MGCLVATIVLGGLVVMTQTSTVQAAGEPSWLDRGREATVALGTVTKARVSQRGKEAIRDIFSVIGTGVVFVAEGKPPVLVTAKHVFYEPAQQWDPNSISVRFAWFEDRAVDDYLGIEIPLKANGKRLWLGHPTADLAAIPLIIRTQEAGRDNVAGVLIQDFASPSDLYEGASIVALGYPGAVGQDFWTRAVVRGGIIAWVNPKGPASEPILVDSMLFPGNSGGPVFKVPSGIGRQGNIVGVVGGRLAFLGIVSQGRTHKMPLVAAGKKIEIERPGGRETLVSEQLVGLAVLEPASRVLELLKMMKWP